MHTILILDSSQEYRDKKNGREINLNFAVSSKKSFRELGYVIKTGNVETDYAHIFTGG
jgi:hypothetical protein